MGRIRAVLTHDGAKLKLSTYETKQTHLEPHAAAPHGTDRFDLAPLLDQYDAGTLKASFMALGVWKAMERHSGVHYDGGIYTQCPLQEVSPPCAPEGLARDHGGLGTAAKAMADRVRYVSPFWCRVEWALLY